MMTLINLINAAVLAGTPLLLATCGEILTEKSGSLNLGVEGMMYMGAIAGLAGAWYAE
ncbi:MAG: ABC transporter permease, partial [Clostridiaceae bacterium]|nr:ABC transporter permease [Clostridiaceae bacterium]